MYYVIFRAANGLMMKSRKFTTRALASDHMVTLAYAGYTDLRIETSEYGWLL